MVFETTRLRVDQLGSADLSDFHELQGDAEVMRYTTGQAMTLSENQADLTKVINCYEDPDNQFWVWAVRHKEDGAFIGTCALIKHGEKDGEIGYRLLRRYWKKGFGSEIVTGLVEYAVTLGIYANLVAYVARDNQASVRILEKSCLNFEKEFKNHEFNWWERYYKLELPTP